MWRGGFVVDTCCSLLVRCDNDKLPALLCQAVCYRVQQTSAHIYIHMQNRYQRSYIRMYICTSQQQCSRGKKAPHCRLRKSGQTYLCTSVAKCGNWSFFGQLVHVLVTVTDLVLDFCLLQFLLFFSKHLISQRASVLRCRLFWLCDLFFACCFHSLSLSCCNFLPQPTTTCLFCLLCLLFIFLSFLFRIPYHFFLRFGIIFVVGRFEFV